MVTGALRFRTPHIEEIPTAQSRQAPGFAWVAVSGPQEDPAKNWGTTNRKRARASVGGQTEQQREALSARQQREIERKIRDLNNDNSNREVAIPSTKKEGTRGTSKAGKTSNTKKILASGKTFAHYLDDEEAEIARTGRRDGDLEVPTASTQRSSKTPIARRKPREESSMSDSPAPSLSAMALPPLPRGGSSVSQGDDAMVIDHSQDEDDTIPTLPSEAEIEALLNAPPLTYNQARSAPPPPSAPPPRRFCETCGYWGRVKCMKCGAMVCSVVCKDDHDHIKCLKMYA
jgi:zinc finger HIT domain-containing protein 1